MNKINLREKLSVINDHWNPRIAAELNGQYVKLVKFKGDFVWHHHEKEDELFLVVRGTLKMKLRDPERTVEVHPGEYIIIPRGVEHCPVADEEVHVVLLEPKSTLNTGNVTNERTVAELERI